MDFRIMIRARLKGARHMKPHTSTPDKTAGILVRMSIARIASAA